MALINELPSMRDFENYVRDRAAELHATIDDAVKVNNATNVLRTLIGEVG